MLKRAIIAAAALAVVAAFAAPAALAWYSNVTASMDCAGIVTWTASAWPGPTPASRENPEVGVWVSYDNGATYEQLGTGAFDQADNYSFTGTFPANDATSVVVKVQALANWPGGGGDVPGPPHYATATRPAGCTSSVPAPSLPVTQTQTPTPKPYCTSSGKLVRLTPSQLRQPPYAGMHLRPATRNAKTGAVRCTRPSHVKAARYTKKRHRKPPRRPRASVHAATLPFTK